MSYIEHYARQLTFKTV